MNSLSPLAHPTSPTSFSRLALSPSLIRVLEELRLSQMTPIQAQSIPILLEGKDLIGQSKTGSGKTAAFALPLLEKVDLKERRPQALVLCPTRELCAQVAREIRKLGKYHSGLQVLTLSGGQPIFTQLNALEKGVHLIVGTPGRILDHLIRRTLDLRRIATVVLDEADRMLEMGFQEDMEKILKGVPKSRQTVLFSATYPKTIETLSRNYQRSPTRVTIEEPQHAAHPIRQVFFEAAPEIKFKALLWLIQQHKPESSMIFCNFKTSVIDLARSLTDVGISVGAIHGDLEQSDRDRVMAKFRNKSIRVLVATDVAARGIDVENLDIVFNFELPSQPDVYVHRIGRTGRAGKKGSAISLASSREKAKLLAVEKLTGTRIEEKTLANLENLDVDQFKKSIHQTAAMATLFISGGRKEKVRPGDILGALTGDAGRLQGSQIGKIEIHDHFSYVAVSKDTSQTVLQRLRSGKIKGRSFRIELVR